ncbi:MAG: hypothetical protein ACYCTI_09530 [Acidimicrobiales bacterium]
MAAVYAVVVVAHVLTVLGALISVGVAGGYCAAVVGGGRGAAVERYFAGGPSWGPRLLYPAALLGLAAAASSRGRVQLGDYWVLAAASLWGVAVIGVEFVLRPAEGAVAESLSSGADGLRGRAGRGVGGAVAVVGSIVAASVLMTVR